MKTYELYYHPRYGYKPVKRGWSWPGFLFTWIWALSCRMWIAATATLALLVVLELAMADAALVISLVFALIYGAFGNSWRRTELLSRGYKCRYTFNAHNPGHALGQTPDPYSLHGHHLPEDES